MRLFLVWDSEGTSEQTDTIVEDLFQAADTDTDSEEPSRKKKKKKHGKKSSSSESEEEEEESGQSSQSKAHCDSRVSMWSLSLLYNSDFEFNQLQ